MFALSRMIVINITFVGRFLDWLVEGEMKQAMILFNKVFSNLRSDTSNNTKEEKNFFSEFLTADFWQKF